jgi:hypothetical protein
VRHPQHGTLSHNDRWWSWGARLSWLVTGLAGSVTFGQALEGRSSAVQLVAAIGLWAGWGVGLVALLTPSTVGLTVARLVVPSALPLTVIAASAGAGTAITALTAAAAAVALVTTFSPDVGERAVQASAYGAERRFPLRPPVSFLAPMVLVWTLTLGAVCIGPLLLAAGQVLAGVAVSALGLVLAGVAGPRFHRLSRRWLVIVPAGLVVHDQVALAETVMLRRQQVASVELAPADTQALDLTGVTWGTPLEIQLVEPETVVPADPTPVRTVAFLVSPSRPGRALAALSKARFARAR